MATGNVFPNTPSDQTDPHMAWWRDVQRLRDELELAPDEDPRQAEQYALEDRIAETPAHSLAGAVVQLRLALSYVEMAASTVNDCDGKALRNAIATLERLP